MNVEALRRRTGDPALAAEDPRPTVAVPNPGLSGIAIAGIAALLAILLFLLLDGQRRNPDPEPAEAGRTQPNAFAPPPPPLVVPTEPVQQPPLQAPPIFSIPMQVQPSPGRQPQIASPPPAPSPAPDISAPPVPQFIPPLAPMPFSPVSDLPALIYDGGAPIEVPTKAESGAPSGPAERADESREAAASPQPVARLSKITNPTTVVSTGTLIRAVLETPIDTSRPGLVRAIVSKDVRGFNGRRTLIPRGSRLIGEYDSQVRTGQRKVLVNWTQLIRPDGSVIRLDSPAADATGGAGLPGRVNSLFFERFANAALQSALALGPSLVTGSSGYPVVIALPTAGVNAATTAVAQGGLFEQPQPKITVKQGTAFSVFVARDLDFSGAAGGG
jgi:type IV secretion system protein VirB10